MQCKLGDFGLSILTNSDHASSLGGSALYMAPELLNRFRTGTKTEVTVEALLSADMYSLGLVLVEVFGGAIPWQGKTFVQLLEAHVSQESRECPLDIRPSAMVNVVNSLLQIDPAKRPNVSELLSTIQKIFTPNSSGRVCDECESAFPAVRCDECQQSLCLPCSMSLHRTGKRMQHNVVLSSKTE